MVHDVFVSFLHPHECTFIFTRYYGPDTGLSFASWMLVGVPIMLLCTMLGWVLLISLFLGPSYLL